MPPQHRAQYPAAVQRRAWQQVEHGAASGIAGARVDRIAAEADSNKAQIYHYFGSKIQLFDAVCADVVAEIVRDIPLDAGDLPGTAARLAQAYEQHPDALRLVAWQRLERSTEPPLPVAVKEATKRFTINRSRIPQPDYFLLLALVLNLLRDDACLTRPSSASRSDPVTVVVSHVDRATAR